MKMIVTGLEKHLNTYRIHLEGKIHSSFTSSLIHYVADLGDIQLGDEFEVTLMPITQSDPADTYYQDPATVRPV